MAAFEYIALNAAGGQEKHLNGFGPAMDGFDHVPFLNLNALRAAIGPATAAILVEPVQGESGIRPIDADNLQRLRKIADEFGARVLDAERKPLDVVRVRNYVDKIRKF